MRGIKSISFGLMLVLVLAFFMHCVTPHNHHNDYDYRISKVDNNNPYSLDIHNQDNHSSEEEKSNNNLDLKCQLHSDITPFSCFDFIFILSDGLKLLIHGVDNEVIYYLNKKYHFLLEGHRYLRGPPTYYVV